MTKQQISIEQFGMVNAYNEQDESIRLADLWSEGVAVLVFVRHFG